MSNLPGVYTAKKTNGALYYRSSITYKNKHISLGSFQTEESAHDAYLFATNLLYTDTNYSVDHYESAKEVISFEKWVMLLNLKSNGMYCKNPIFLHKNYFIYYLDEQTPLKFDTDDLFYYTRHKIMRRGGHLFVSDYGMQVNILARYGIKNYAVCGRDYLFSNNDCYDFRYRNIEIVNRYHGVCKTISKGRDWYVTKILICGNYIVGRYKTEVEAAIAYNKAANLLNAHGFHKNFPENYIESIDDITYAKLYNSVRISQSIKNLIK